MGTLSRLRVFFVLAVLVAGWAGGSQVAAAQDEEEGFPLVAFSAYCPPDYAGPFVDCTPWDGVTVMFDDVNSEQTWSCATVAGDRAASCTVYVPFGSTIIAAIDETTIPEGYVLQQNSSQSFEIPDGPPEGVFGGPAFVLLEQQDGGEAPAETVALPITAGLCADGYAPHDDCNPWEGALVTVTADDGTWLGECTTATIIEYAAGCEVTVPRGTTVVASISLDTLPADYTVAATELVIDIPAEGDPEWAAFFAVAVADEGEYTPLPVYASICADALPPNDDCQPWEGVTIVATVNDATGYADACVTETFFETVAGCEIMMPRGANVTASISDEQVPEGYELFVEVPTWDMPEEGVLESGPYFFLVEEDGETPAPVPTQAPSPKPTAPVTGLPSTGSGTGGNGLATYLLLGGASALLVAGAGYASTLRKR